MVERQKTLIEEEKSLQDSIFQLRDLEAQTQSEIEEASSREDYEAADQLSERLELLKGKTLECGGAISDKHNEYAELEREKSKLYAEQQNFLAEVVAKSKEIRDKERRELDLLEKAIENYKKTTSDNLEASAIELEVTTDETTKHKEEVESKKALLDAEIVKQTGELENEKAEYETTLASVTDEIRQIEAKLSELKNQQKNLTKKISETNQVIEEKLENFQSQLLELANEQAFIASEFEQLELKKEKLIKEQVTYEAELGNQQSLINTKTKWVDDYQVVITEAEADIHRIEEIVETRQQRLIELEKAELALREKQKSMVEAEEYEREVKNNYELFMQNIVQKEARIREIETRIPGLEAEKKTFASAKLFKDAGRVANEIKACYGEREALDEELKELKRRLPDERQTLEVTEADLRAMRSELDELAQVLEAAKEGLLKSE